MWFRHTAIYYSWDGINDTEERTNHLIIESDGGPGVIPNDYSELYSKGYKGAGALPHLTAAERRLIVELAYSRLGYKYHFFKGYKDRLIGSRFFQTYRCDGLAEHCYEIATGTYGIVNDIHWNGTFPHGLSPLKQQNAMGAALGIKPYVSITNIIPSQYMDGKCYVIGMSTIESNDVTDGVRGSGIAQVEFWAGDSDSSPDTIATTGIFLGKDVKKVLIKGDYSYNWYTPQIDDGEYAVYAKAFDQAGNTKVSERVRVIVNNIPPIIINQSPTGEISETKPTISATIVSEDNVVPVDLSSILVTLDGIQVTHSASSNVNSCSVEVSYIPSDDLDTGPHSVTIDAKDISGLASKQKTWSFTITPTTGGDWRNVYGMLNWRRNRVEKEPVSVSHPEDIDMEGVLIIREGTKEILGDYGYTNLSEALHNVGYAQDSWSEGFDCKDEIQAVLNSMRYLAVRVRYYYERRKDSRYQGTEAEARAAYAAATPWSWGLYFYRFSMGMSGTHHPVYCFPDGYCFPEYWRFVYQRAYLTFDPFDYWYDKLSVIKKAALTVNLAFWIEGEGRPCTVSFYEHTGADDWNHDVGRPAAIGFAEGKTTKAVDPSVINLDGTTTLIGLISGRDSLVCVFPTTETELKEWAINVYCPGGGDDPPILEIWGHR